MTPDTLALTLGILLTAVVVTVFIVVFVVIARKSRDKKTQDEYAARYRERVEASKVTRDAITRNTQPKPTVDKHQLHQQDAKAHEHVGEEEHYEEIVGSLGEVNDEGCEDLSGVRFIVRDMAYETSDGDQVDYGKLAKAIVLGEVLNNPRFKKPYTRK